MARAGDERELGHERKGDGGRKGAARLARAAREVHGGRASADTVSACRQSPHAVANAFAPVQSAARRTTMPMIDRCRRALLVAAAAYLALLPTGAFSFWRSLAFAASLACASVVAAAFARDRKLAMPLPNRAIPIAVAAWALWSLASLAWSVNPGYTLDELTPDVVWGVATLAIFYVAAVSQASAFHRLAATMLGALALWTALAAGLALSPLGWDARPFHRGDGAFATYIVTAAPFLWLLAWPRPPGLASGRWRFAGAALMLALVVVTARLSENRIVWIALTVQAVIVALCVPAASRVRVRSLAAMALAVVAFAIMFADAARERALEVRPADASIAGAIAGDPRLAIWSHAIDHVRERPWLGYGYGLHILGRKIGEDSGDAKIMHPHNLLIGQWLQTGAIGAALFVVMLASFAVRFAGDVRTRDPALACYGALGLAVLAGYVVRNLTDDFFIRANGKLLFAALAVLLAAGTLRRRAIEGQPPP